MTLATGCLPLFYFAPCRSPSFSQHIDWLNPPVKLLGGGGVLWRLCSFTPVHSLTGPVGQPFASHLGELRFPAMHPHFWNWDLLLAMSHYRSKFYVHSVAMVAYSKKRGRVAEAERQRGNIGVESQVYPAPAVLYPLSCSNCPILRS
jgi:hypothetical protein